MEDLRALMKDLGFGQVRTLLNSGNVVFSGTKSELRKAALRIQEGLEKKLDVSARVTVISAEELAAVVAANPLGKVAADPSRLLIGILGDPADREKLAKIATKDWGEERIVLGEGRAVYMWMPHGVIQSKLNAAVSKALKDAVTARNWSTMLKLSEMTGK
jgi:uncharacterized protein (DUF1697 family)